MWNDLTMQQRADVIYMAVKAGMRDLDSIRSFYDETLRSRKFGDGGDTKNVSNTPKDREVYNRAVEGKNFINSYVHSPGFAKRLALLTKDYEINPEFKISPTIKIIKDGDSYSEPLAGNGKVYINPEDEKVYDWGKNKRAYVYDRFGDVDVPKGMVSAHELGHILDAQLARSSNFRDKNPWYIPSKHLPAKTFHSNRYPQLMPSKKVNNHDKSNEESYADLIAFRKYLKDKGIYDSNSINDFTKEHLLKAKKTAKKNDEFIRLLHNFTDKEVINIMNTVAQNTMNSSNVLLDIPFDIPFKNIVANGGHLTIKKK